MKNLWDPKEASQFEENTLQMRVYSSRLLGQNSDLVLHGGGNTSVKVREINVFGEEEDILYVKGSGNNLATIEAHGFTPLRLMRFPLVHSKRCSRDYGRCSRAR